MKVYHSKFYINSTGSVSKRYGLDSHAVIDIAQFNHFTDNRKQRRALQSVAARQLLEGSLEKYFPKFNHDAWNINKFENGKPVLSGVNAPSISITHSGDWCATAISGNLEVGVDAEIIKHHDWALFSNSVFHPEEARWVLAASGVERDVRGLTCWCRKEAFLKALGLGISCNLSEIGFSDTNVLIEVPGNLDDYIGWRFLTKVVCKKVVIAVALQG